MLLREQANLAAAVTRFPKGSSKGGQFAPGKGGGSFSPSSTTGNRGRSTTTNPKNAGSASQGGRVRAKPVERLRDANVKTTRATTQELRSTYGATAAGPGKLKVELDVMNVKLAHAQAKRKGMTSETVEYNGPGNGTGAGIVRFTGPSAKVDKYLEDYDSGN